MTLEIFPNARDQLCTEATFFLDSQDWLFYFFNLFYRFFLHRRRCYTHTHLSLSLSRTHAHTRTQTPAFDFFLLHTRSRFLFSLFHAHTYTHGGWEEETHTLIKAKVVFLFFKSVLHVGRNQRWWNGEWVAGPTQAADLPEAEHVQDLRCPSVVSGVCACVLCPCGWGLLPIYVIWL